MSDTLREAMNVALLRRLAGDGSYRRGHDYYLHGHVQAVAETPRGLRASVRGSLDYTVHLSADEGVLDYGCDCPAGAEGAFCKHCVAAALAWMKRSDGVTAQLPAKSGEMTLARAAKVLLEEDQGVLVQMLTKWAGDDPQLREQILLYASKRAGPEAGLVAVRKAFDDAVRVRGFVEYREASSWAHDVHRAIGAMEELLREGQAAGVIGLCEQALQKLQAAIERVDDSDGHFGDLRDRLQDLHYQACLQARPEPAALAKRLFQWELEGDYDVFSEAVLRYAEILGPAGLKIYRELAEEKWARVPALGPGQRETPGRFAITRIMESLARLSGDVQQHVAVLRRNLSAGYDYLRIAEIYREAGQGDPALEWAERGLASFPDRPDNRLREFVAEEYHRRGRHDEAMKLVWAEFLDAPGSSKYQTLHEHAVKAGTWPEWRERALAEIRRRIATAKQEVGSRTAARWTRPISDHSPLVEICLYEGDTEAAWREAKEGGCHDGLWLQLAAARQNDHPADAAGVYLQQADMAIAETRNSRYDQAVDLLTQAAKLMKRLGRSPEFVRQLEALRVKYKIKRNFIKLLDQKRGALY